MKDFITRIFIFSLAIAILDLVWIRVMPVERHLPHTWMVLGFFVLATIIFHSTVVNSAKGDPQSFVRSYMSMTAAKLILYGAVIVIYAFIDRTRIMQFALGFVAHYLLFSVFEVRMLLRQLRK